MNGEIKVGRAEEVLREFQTGLVDLTVTSPPYDDMRSYTSEAEWSWEVFEKVCDELYRVTSEGGVVVWNVADKTKNGAKTCTSFRHVLRFVDAGFLLADTMIWEKTGTSMGSNRLYHSNYEFAFIFAKGKHRTFNPIRDRKNVKGPVTEKVGGGGLLEGISTNKSRSVTYSEFGKRNNIWRIQPSQKQKGHPAPFPVEFARDHILSWSNEGDLVLDPFMGSGTTAIAAEMTNRNWLGIEVSSEYAEIARRRIERALS